MVSLLAAALVAGCSGDPTEDLRTGISSLTASPSTLNVTLGKNKTTLVTAVDSQGNQITSTFEVTDVGPGITVKRDSSYLPIFVNDSTLSVPPEAPAFQFVVTATGLESSHFTVTSGDKTVTIPVIVAPDPLTVPISTVATAGATSIDTTTITAPAGYIFSPTSTVAFDAGDAATLGVSADGTQLFINAPPGATSKGIVTGVTVPYFPTAIVSDSTDVPVTISATVPARPGTDDISTAPELVAPTVSGARTGLFDGNGFGAANCGGNSGAPCQLYKLTVPSDVTIDATLTWNNDADMGLYVLDANGDDADTGPCDADGRAAGEPETCGGVDGLSDPLVFTAGTYYLAVVSFGPFYPLPGAVPPDPAAGGPDPNPDWVKIDLVAE
jgi:hypothetical protein